MKRISKALQQKIGTVCKKYGISCVVLYGSSLKTNNPGDYDIALYTLKPLKTSLAKIQYLLQAFFKRPLDVVLLTHKTDPLLGHEIISQGEILYESKKNIFLDFSVYMWKKYLDTRKFRKLENFYIKEGLKYVS